MHLYTISEQLKKKWWHFFFKAFLATVLVIEGHKIHPFDNTSQIILLLFWKKYLDVIVCRNDL